LVANLITGQKLHPQKITGPVSGWGYDNGKMLIYEIFMPQSY